uniref:CUE domain-containing protein n=1 Tax=Eptatretus burgeri TaxID=7764 RepID=A0A8C4QGQ8_EPTBU
MPRRRRVGNAPSGWPARTEGLHNAPVPEQLFNESLAAFPHLDAQVVYMVLAECGFNADVAMDSLLELNDEARLTVVSEENNTLAQDTGNGSSVPTSSLGAHCVLEPIDVTISPEKNRTNDYKMDIHQGGMKNSTCGDAPDNFYPKNKQIQNSQAFPLPSGDVMLNQPPGDSDHLETLSYTTFIPGNVSHGLGQKMDSSHFDALNDRNLDTKYCQNETNNQHPFIGNVTQSDFYKYNCVSSLVTSVDNICDAGCMDELIMEDPKDTVNKKCAVTAEAPSLVSPNIIGSEKSEIECSGSTKAPPVLCEDDEKSKANITINPTVVASETRNAKLNSSDTILSSSDYFQASNTLPFEDPLGHVTMPQVSLMPTWRTWRSAPPSAIADYSGMPPYPLKTPWQQVSWAGKFVQHTEGQCGPKPTWPAFIVPKVPYCAKESATLNWRVQQPSPVAKIPIVRGQKMLILLRGLPGSGKSTMARKIRMENKDAAVLSTDDYFVQGGIYSYNPDLLSEAHEWNHKRAREAMDACKSPVIIDNTNLKLWEMKPYVAMARQRNYSIMFLEPDTPWKFNPKQLERKNSHGISKERINRMMAHYEHQVDVEKILSSFQTKPVMNQSDPEQMNIQQTLNEPSQRTHNPFTRWQSHGDAAQPLKPRKNIIRTKDQLKYLQNLAKNVAVGEYDGNRKRNHQGLKNSSGKKNVEFPSFKGNHGAVERESNVESYDVKATQSLEQLQNEQRRKDGHSNSGNPEEQHLENLSEPLLLLGKDIDFPGEWPGSSQCRVLEQRSRRSRKCCEKEETTVDAGSINSTAKIANHDSTHSTVESNETSLEIIAAPTATSVVAQDLVQKHSSEKPAQAPLSFETDILKSVHPEEVANMDVLDVPALVQAELNCEKSKSFAFVNALSTIVEPGQNASPLLTGKCLAAEEKVTVWME